MRGGFPVLSEVRISGVAAAGGGCRHHEGARSASTCQQLLPPSLPLLRASNSIIEIQNLSAGTIDRRPFLVSN